MARQYGNNTPASARAEARVVAEGRQKATIIRTVEMIASGVALLIGVITLGVGIYTSSVKTNEFNEICAEIESQNLIMADKKAQVDNNIKTVKVVKNSAAEPGLYLCNLQNKLGIEIRINGSNRYMVGNLTDNVSTNDYIATPMTVAHQQLIAELRDFLNTNFLSTGDKPAFVTKTWCPYGQWEFEGTYTYSMDEQRLYNWKCYAITNENVDATGKHNVTVDRNKLLSVVTMSYNPVSKAFSNASIYNTPYYYEEQAKQPLLGIEGETSEDVHDRIDGTDSDTSQPDDGNSDNSSDNTSDNTSSSDNTSGSDSNTSNNNSGSGASSNPSRPSVPAEIEYFYSWSSAYGEWGYFDSNGTFYTIEEYEALMR